MTASLKQHPYPYCSLNGFQFLQNAAVKFAIDVNDYIADIVVGLQVFRSDINAF